MKVRLVTLRRASGSSSLRIYPERIREALQAAGPDPVELVALNVPGEGRRGGVIRPALYQLTHSFPRDDGIWHATEPNSALRGTDVVTLHDFYPFTASGLMFSIFRWSTRRAARRARRIVVQTEAVRTDVGRFLGHEAWTKTVVIPPPFALPPLGRLSDRYDVLWVGTLEQRKRPDWFLQQLATVSSPRLRVAFLCHRSGYGSEESVTRAFEEARRVHDVEWLTRDLTDEELDQLYRASRVLVSTSLLEGYHTPVMEAWARGTAVVVPRIDLYGQIYGSVEGVRYYDTQGTFLPVLLELLKGPPFVPDPVLLESVSGPAVGRRLWSVYRELRSGGSGGTSAPA
jgi:glycosyltransferase involved in cell wall biosynthesis